MKECGQAIPPMDLATNNGPKTTSTTREIFLTAKNTAKASTKILNSPMKDPSATISLIPLAYSPIIPATSSRETFKKAKNMERVCTHGRMVLITMGHTNTTRSTDRENINRWTQLTGRGCGWRVGERDWVSW